MDDLVNKLIETMQKEYEAYQDILKIAKNKTEVVVEGKINELKSLTNAEQVLVLQLGKLEGTRESIVEEIAKLLGENPDELTISGLLKHVTGRFAAGLQEYQKKMTDVVKELRNVNSLNQRLIQDALEYINFSVNLFSNLRGEANVYGSDGKPAKSKKKNFFDVKK